MARTKHVFRNAEEVAHVWASRNHDHGRTPTRHCFFNGDAIWSYGDHYCLAQFHKVREDRMDKTIALVNNTTVSSTTTQHQWAVRGALRGGVYEVFEVCSPREPFTSLLGLMVELKEDLTKQLSQRDRMTPEEQQRWFDAKLAHIHRFAKLFKFKVYARDIKPLKKLNAEVLAITERRLAKKQAIEDKLAAMTPEERQQWHDKEEAKRERARERRELMKLRGEAEGIIKKLERFAEHEYDSGSFSWSWRQVRFISEQSQSVLTPEQLERYKAAEPRARALWDRYEEADRLDQQAKAARRAALMERIPEAIEAWKENRLREDPDLSEAYHLRGWDGPTLLRLVDGRVETSRSAQVTEEAGKRLFCLYRRVMRDLATIPACERWIPPQPVRVDHYELRWITREGNVQIGCHELTKPEIDDFIERVRWSSLPVDDTPQDVLVDFDNNATYKEGESNVGY